MKVSGFTFIRNALTYDYPIVEAIQSILPICDEFVVAVGNSEDETLQLIRSIPSDKIKIIETVWDDSQRVGGKVLAIETDKAFAAIAADSDWAFYIQGDEVVHEKYLPVIREAMEKNVRDTSIDGLLFHYLHFYGSYDYVGVSSNWYKNEIRVIRNNKKIYSYRDAQGFRKEDNQKLRVRSIDAWMYHYGWVKDPRSMQKKQLNFNKYWHDDEWVDKHVAKSDAFKYEEKMTALERFQGSHPTVMLPRIHALNWTFDLEIAMNKKSIKDHFKSLLFRFFGIDLSYKNYIKVK
ncbi:MAG: glycosyltransferase family 2 protein [Cytophagaceae bacterium]|jgi:hypothetical protein|nr:glycosyltransferase family 2 protein [Cytophagaceae bacterium]